MTFVLFGLRLSLGWYLLDSGAHFLSQALAARYVTRSYVDDDMTRLALGLTILGISSLVLYDPFRWLSPAKLRT